MDDIKVNDTDAASIVESKHRDFKVISIWASVLAIYLFLLCAIGYIAFWDQDFNNPKHNIGPYITMLSEYKKGNVSANSSLSEREVVLIIQEMMKKDADSAGDMQELASQSFHIVLGAILASLSASATMIFHKLNETKSKKEK